MNTHPIHRLEAAESALVASLDAATARLDAVGTTRLDAAMARFQASAVAAQERLARAGMSVQTDAADLLSSILAFAEELTPPAPAEAPAPPAPEPVYHDDCNVPAPPAAYLEPLPVSVEEAERMGDPVNRLDSIPFDPFAARNGKATKTRKKR